MKQALGVSIGVIAVALATGAGYWVGRRGVAAPVPGAAQSVVMATAADSGANTQKKPLYYRNPMGLPDTSPTPKKDPMGMDYVAVFEGDVEPLPASPRQIRISAEKIQKLGVRTELAELRSLGESVRAVGRVEPDERRSYMVAPKFEGYVERLHVNASGQQVTKGQALFEVYSPELVSVQREYAIAAQGVAALKGADSPAQLGMARLVESSLQRLRNWDISPEQIKALVASGETQRSLTFRSPVSGIVTEKKAVQGMRFMPGEVLYQVTDLTSVWVIADVFEQDIGLLRTGARVRLRINAYPDREFTGTVAYVYPTLRAETRSVPVRVELANPGLLLKPGMFAQAEIALPSKARAVTVPLSAVIDSGTRQMVLLSLGEGRFEPREVRLGRRSDSHVEVLAGVKAGDKLVSAANFLIDAESNLKAALGGFGDPGKAGQTPTASAAASAGVSHSAQASVDSINLKDGSVTLSHGPVPSLQWPAMTMDFKAANASLLKGLQPGSRLAFEFVERAQGEWVITRVKLMATTQAPATPASATRAHAGH